MQYSALLWAAALLGLTATPVLSHDTGLRLENVQGRISVQMPIGFLPAEEGLAVHVGQKIVVRANSSAIIESQEGSCFVALRKPGVFTVPHMDACMAGQVVVFDGTFQITPANGGAQPMMANASGGFTPMVAAGGFVAVTFGSALWTTFGEQKNQLPVTMP
jgi:hypothetical protein